MKTKLLSVFALASLLTVSAYAQDNTAASKKELRKQARAQKVANTKADVKEAGQKVGDAAEKVGEEVKKDAKVVGKAVNKGVDKAGYAIQNEADKLKAKRDSARRDTL
jgi:hypothetical protein